MFLPGEIAHAARLGTEADRFPQRGQSLRGSRANAQLRRCGLDSFKRPGTFRPATFVVLCLSMLRRSSAPLTAITGSPALDLAVPRRRPSDSQERVRLG